MTSRMPALTSDEIRQTILFVRGEKIMLDADLAALYGVPTRALVQVVKRNPARFPSDFVFQLTAQELAGLRSQSVISNERRSRGGRRFLPYAFTKHGVAMLSSVLRTKRAIQVNVAIMRTFVRLRRILQCLVLGPILEQNFSSSGARSRSSSAGSPC